MSSLSVNNISEYSKNFTGSIGHKIFNTKDFRLFINKIVNDKSRVARSVELNLMNDDGVGMWLELTCEPVLDVNNRVVRIIGTYSDITMQKGENCIK
jgi:hypothetical protein